MWKAIVKGLGKNPAYLLVFSVCSLFFLTGIGAAIASVAKGGDLSFALVALASFAVGLGAAVWVVRLDVGRKPAEELPAFFKLMVHSNEGKQLGENLVAVADNILDAFQLGSAALSAAILERLSEVRAESGEWAIGQLSAKGAASNQLLLHMYQTAMQSIFATAVPEYHDAVWNRPFGSTLLAAQGASGAEVTRVFLFNRRSELTNSLVETMKRHNDADVRVRVYFDDEDELFDFTPDINRDFIIIDNGAAIAVSEGSNPDYPQSRWFLGDEDRVQRFRGIRDNLVRGSLQLSEILEWWSQHGAGVD